MHPRDEFQNTFTGGKELGNKASVLQDSTDIEFQKLQAPVRYRIS